MHLKKNSPICLENCREKWHMDQLAMKFASPTILDIAIKRHKIKDNWTKYSDLLCLLELYLIFFSIIFLSIYTKITPEINLALNLLANVLFTHACSSCDSED